MGAIADGIGEPSPPEFDIKAGLGYVLQTAPGKKEIREGAN